MPTELIEFWREFKPEGAPYFHPRDKDILGRVCPGSISGAEEFRSYLDGPNFGSATDKSLHLSLLPIPFIGNLAKADIIVLLLNPGLQHSDYWAEQNSPAFCGRLMGNLSQSFDGVEFPFLFLDPPFCWHSGFMWWERKLGAVIRELADDHFGGKYLDALRSLSNRLACVELVPYHSKVFDGRGGLCDLPSAKAARDFVEKLLIPDADLSQTIVVTRKVKEWGLTNVHPNRRGLIVYGPREARAAHLSPDSKGGKAILNRYRGGPPK